MELDLNVPEQLILSLWLEHACLFILGHPASHQPRRSLSLLSCRAVTSKVISTLTLMKNSMLMSFSSQRWALACYLLTELEMRMLMDGVFHPILACCQLGGPRAYSKGTNKPRLAFGLNYFKQSSGVHFLADAAFTCRVFVPVMWVPIICLNTHLFLRQIKWIQ